MIQNKLKFVGRINIRRDSFGYLFLCYQKFGPIHSVHGIICLEGRTNDTYKP